MSSRLSPRESEILRAICEGRTTKEIAAAVGIAESTVDRHVADTLRKLNAASRAEAVFRAYRAGALDEAPELPILPVASAAVHSDRTPMRSRVLAAGARWAIAAAILMAFAVGISGLAGSTPLFRFAPVPTLPPPTFLPPATSSPGP